MEHHHSLISPIARAEEHPDHHDHPQEIRIGQVKERWIVLFTFCLLSFSNAMIWTTFSPIAEITKDKYSIGNFELTSLSLIFMALYPPFSLLSAWVLDIYGLKPAVLLIPLPGRRD